MGRLSIRAVRVGLLAYLGLILMLSMLQTWMIFPGHATQGRPDAMVHPRAPQELVTLTTKNGDTIRALYVPAAPRQAGKALTVIFYYGNAMTVADSFGQIRMFHDLGCNVMVPDYPGFGMSSGKPSEASLYAAADACYDHLLTRGDVDPKGIVAAGWSLGAAVATDLAARRPCRGLITFCAFTSMADMSHEVLPFFPTRLLLHHKFDNLAKFPTIRCPIFVAHGCKDSIVPTDMSKRLATAAHVTPVLVQGADHNDFFEVGEGELVPALRSFLETLQSPSLGGQGVSSY